ncbi:MAG: adenosylhomocysteinase [archaeon]|nr:adenosylhomocysteinase [archaeon]
MVKTVCSKKWGNDNYLIADESDETLAKGQEELRIALNKMPVTQQLIDRFEKEKPLNGLKIAMCLHVTKETANLCRAAKAGGAEVYLCGSNPLSTQDHTATALAAEGIHVFAWTGNTSEEFYECLDECLKIEPNIIIDDGADLIITAHQKYPQFFEKDGCVIACQEETTTGIHRFEAMDKAGALKTALYAVNDASCKNQFDNELGTGQGVVAAIYGMHVLFAGKIVVVAGYGHCSSGMALRSRGLGARVIVTEVDPVQALKATFAGFEVGKMEDIIDKADMIFTATGCKNVVCEKHIDKLKEGCILANLGHFDIEIMAKDLYSAAGDKVRTIRPNVEELTLPNGNRVYLLAQGRLANLAISEGHPSEVMDMSFGLQGLMAEFISKNRDTLKDKKGMMKVPEDINNAVAHSKLKAMGVEIDEWTPEQRAYCTGYEEGT